MFKVGDRVVDWAGDKATVIAVDPNDRSDPDIQVRYDNEEFCQDGWMYTDAGFDDEPNFRLLTDDD